MKTRKWGIAALIILLAAVGYFFLAGDETPSPAITASTETAPPPAAAEPVPATPPAAPEPPPILHPIETAPSADPLPELGNSDAPFRKALGEVIGKKGLSLVLSEELIHHIVVTVDNLPRKHLPASIVPLQRAEGPFAVDGQGETLAIGARNARRYAVYAAVAKTIDSARLVDLYRRFYPLFQRAYQEIGYPKGNFNDRLVAAIDDLLAAPDPETPIRLTQPKILFEYADPDLENRSAGQKIMLRIGRENAAVIKAKLGEIRGQVAR